MSILRFVILFFAIGILAPAIYSQCTTQAGYICISQTDADRQAKANDELANARAVIQKFTNERGAQDALSVATTNLLKAANEALDYKDKVIVDIERLNAMYEKVVQLQSVLIEKLTSQINRPKSAFTKFVEAVEKIALLALGITVGRGL